MAFRLLEEADYESFNKHFKVLDKDDLDFVSSKETPYESAGYIRGPWLELHDAIHKLQDAKSSEPQRNMLRIYADTLVSRSKVDLPDMALVVLFARNLFPTSSSSDPVKIGATRGATITMYSGVPGRELPFEITTSSGTVRENVTIPASHSGVELYIKPEGAITVHEKNMDKKLLGPANPIDQLEDDGNFREIDQDTSVGDSCCRGMELISILVTEHA